MVLCPQRRRRRERNLEGVAPLFPGRGLWGACTCVCGQGRQSPGVQTNLPGDPALPPHTPIRPSPPAPAEQLRSGRFSSGEPLPHFQMLLSLSCHSDPSVLSLPTHGPWLSAFHLLERSRPVLEGRPSGFSTAKSTLGCRSFSLPWNSVHSLVAPRALARLRDDSPPLWSSSGSVALSFQDLVCCRRLASGH